MGGSRVRLTQLEYLKRNGRRKRRGRPRTKRGKSGTGLYPCLAALGICFGVTPALAGEICAQVADSDSVRAGRSALARRDIDLVMTPLLSAWSELLPKFHQTDVQVSNHMVLLSEPESVTIIVNACEKIYSDADNHDTVVA